MGLIRLPQVQTDILITYNTPQVINPGSSSAAVVDQVPKHRNLRTAAILVFISFFLFLFLSVLECCQEPLCCIVCFSRAATKLQSAGLEFVCAWTSLERDNETIFLIWDKILYSKDLHVAFESGKIMTYCLLWKKKKKKKKNDLLMNISLHQSSIHCISLFLFIFPFPFKVPESLSSGCVRSFLRAALQ